MKALPTYLKCLGTFAIIAYAIACVCAIMTAHTAPDNLAWGRALGIALLSGLCAHLCGVITSHLKWNMRSVKALSIIIKCLTFCLLVCCVMAFGILAVAASVAPDDTTWGIRAAGAYASGLLAYVISAIVIRFVE